MGFYLPQGRDSSSLLPYEQAHTVLGNLVDGVNLILLCARIEEVFASSLNGLCWLINELFYGGRAPIALVVTQFDTPDKGFWERTQGAIAQTTGIPVQSIPHVCITTMQTSCNQSRETLKLLLEKYATIVPPISLTLHLSSSTKTTAPLLASHCGLNISKATALAEQLSRPPRPFNVVILGNTGAGKSWVINLIAGHPVAEVSPGAKVCTLYPRPYKISTGMQRFLMWDTTVGFHGAYKTHDLLGKAFVELLGRDVVGHACIPIIPGHSRDANFRAEVLASRLAI